MADRKSLLFSAVLVIAGEVVYQVALQFHPGNLLSPIVPDTPASGFTAYAHSTYWALIHEAQFAGDAIVLFGMLALFFALGVNAGLAGVVNRFAAASAVAALALNGALYGVDGIALKQAVDAWVSAPASQQPVFYAVVQGIRGVEWAMRSYVDFTTGLSLVLFAIVIASTARISRPIGYIMGLSGLAYLAQGYSWGTGYTSISTNFVLPEQTYQFLILVWVIWLLVSALRMKESVQAAPA